MSAFCGTCGAPQPEPSRFCVNCGAPLGQPTEAANQSPAAPVVSPVAPSRRPALVAGGAALSLVVVVGGVLAATTLSGDGSAPDLTATGSSQRREVSAVTESPIESWTWTADGSGDGLGIRADGDLVVVSDTSNEEVTRLDSDGTEMWQGEGVFVLGVDAQADLVWVATVWEGDGFAALDADTGEERWRQPDYHFSTQLDDGKVWASRYEEAVDISEGAVIDRDGQVRWQTEGDQFVAIGDAVATVNAGELSVLDAATGDERWSVRPDLEPDPDYGSLSLTATAEMVVVSGVEAGAAYDLATGKELWTEDDLYDYSEFSTTGGSLVFTQRSGDTESYEDGQVDFFDSSGPVGTLTLDPDEYFYPGFLPVAGEGYLTDSNSGIVYDQALQPAGSFDGDVIPADGGFYQVFNGELSYRLLDGTEKWSRQVADPDDYAQITPLDGRLLVTMDDTVTGYE